LFAQQDLILRQQMRQVRAKRQPHPALRPTHDTHEPHELPDHMREQQPVQTTEEFDDTNTFPTNKQPENMLTDNPREETIFVSIASYRDPECIATVLDLFRKAQYPGRVFVGVYEQNDPETDQQISLAHLLQNEPDRDADIQL